MKTMKRALTLIMAVMMVAAMAACGNKPAASNGDETTGDGSLKRVQDAGKLIVACETSWPCLLYTSPSPRDYAASRMPSSA